MARRVTVPLDADPAEVLRALGTPRPRALLLLIGGADAMDPALSARMQHLVSRGLVPAATEREALILDGGTRTGIMGLVGQAVADRGHRCPLVGVAPEGRVTAPGDAERQDGTRAELDPNHSYFVLVRGEEWGSETDMLFHLASTLGREVPVLVVLVNGGAITRDEALRAVRRGWPLAVIQGSGRLADEIAAALQAPSAPVTDPVLAEIVGDGRISLFPMDGPADAFERLLLRLLGEETVLTLGWRRFATYDANAAREQRTFRRLQLSVLLLGVLSTASVLLESTLVQGTPLARVLRVLIVILAASLTALVAATSRFKAGNKWILLRANAEAIKRELYRYRCQECPRVARPRGPYEQELARKLKALSHQHPRSGPPLAVLRSYTGPLPPPGSVAKGDDGFSALTPERYLQVRLDDQLDWYHCRIDELDRQWWVLQWTVIILGGIGTVLAAFARLELWVALTTSMVMALTTYLGYQQAEAKLTRYQQAATDLENLKAWWRALSVEQQCDYRTFDTLVEDTELILQGEVSGWVQDMKEALLRLDARREREKAAARHEKPHS